MKLRYLAPALAAPVAAGVLAIPALAHTFQVNVHATNATCKLALLAVNKPNTAIDFHIINNGTIAHGIVVHGVHSTMVPPKSAGDVIVNFHKAGTYHYACTAGKYLHPTITGRGMFTIRQ
jgi:hypothetical protein